MSETKHEHELTTKKFAELNGVNQGTVLTRFSLRGSYFGVTPIKLANGRLLWPSVQVKA